MTLGGGRDPQRLVLPEGGLRGHSEAGAFSPLGILCPFFSEMQCLGNARSIWLWPGHRSGPYSCMTRKVPEEGSHDGLTGWAGHP